LENLKRLVPIGWRYVLPQFIFFPSNIILLLVWVAVLLTILLMQIMNFWAEGYHPVWKCE
jgi:hypothetical protein